MRDFPRTDTNMKGFGPVINSRKVTNAQQSLFFCSSAVILQLFFHLHTLIHHETTALWSDAPRQQNSHQSSSKTPESATPPLISEPGWEMRLMDTNPTIQREGVDWLGREMMIFKCQSGCRTLCLFCQTICSVLISIAEANSAFLSLSESRETNQWFFCPDEW